MYTAGIDLGGTNLKVGLFDSDMTCVYTQTARSIRGDSLACAQQIRRMLEDAPYKAEKIGVGVPGAVFRPSGKVNSGNLRWMGVYFGETLARVTGLPVWLDNDAQCALAAETLLTKKLF